MKKKVTDFYRLRVTSCYQLIPGSWHGVRFDGVERANCYAFPDGHGVRLAYHLNGKPVVSDVPFCWTSQPFGGRRMWLVCPQCGTRRGCLYFTGSGLQCADCMGGLLYECQTTDRTGWSLIRRWQGRLADGEQRPRYMHHQTYERLIRRIRDLENYRVFQFIGGWEGLAKINNQLEGGN